jgi:trans-aconitate methyltransferase
MRMLNTLWRSVREPTFCRDLLWSKLRRPPGLFQVTGSTGNDRYPEIFRLVSDRLGGATARRLLSFGCSTGEEVFTLRRYFPRAAIEGIDINPYRIAACRRQLRRRGGDPGLSFSVAGSTRHLSDRSYDAIFCLAVLRRGELRNGPAPRCDHLVRFDDFERVVADFARCLKPGGYLAVTFSNFRLADTTSATAFEVAMQANAAWMNHMRAPLYGRDNRLLPGARYGDIVFRKRADPVEGLTARAASQPADRAHQRVEKE